MCVKGDYKENVNKSKVMVNNEESQRCRIMLNNELLKQMSEFKFLG